MRHEHSFWEATRPLENLRNVEEALERTFQEKKKRLNELKKKRKKKKDDLNKKRSRKGERVKKKSRKE